MKGAIFKLLEDYVTTVRGPDAWDDLLDATELETVGPFVGPGTYPPGDLMGLIGAAVEQYDMEVEDLLRGFGRHAFAGLASSVTPLLEDLDCPHMFLVNLESVIHTEVRKLEPEARPPRFEVSTSGHDTLLLHYRSPFGLFALVEGLLEGLGDWYGIPVESERVSVAGTNAVFRVTTPVTTPQAPDGGDGSSAPAEPVGVVKR